MIKKITLISVLLITFFVSCKPRGNSIPKPLSAGKSASELKVASQSQAFIEETQLLSLSPDGKWLFGQRLESACIFDSSTLAEKVCVSWKSSIDPTGISWSPDSQRVAFTENLSALNESDIWVFDISTGALNNLTNDGLEGDISSSIQRAQSKETIVNLDSLPTWSPDGKTLAFVRSTYGDKKETFICLIPVTGGEVTKVIIADSTHSLAVWHGVRWTPDGKKILFTITVLEDTTGKNGIWIVDKTGKNIKQLAKDKEGWGYVSLYDVSAKGDKILIGYPRALTRADKNPNLCFFELLDLKTGAITPLIESPTDLDPSSTEVRFYSPTQAAFSPDGSKIIYHYNQGGADQPTPQLVVRDVNDTQEAVLASHTIYQGEDVGSSLFWGENDTVYMITGSGLGTLYHLSGK
jgi:Tol biopolymer transport system component